MKVAALILLAVACWAGNALDAPVGMPAPTSDLFAAKQLTRDLSVYGYHGDASQSRHRMANGKKFDPEAFTCATPFKRVGGKIVDEFKMG